MLSAYKYRIYPNSGQEMRLKRSLDILRGLYNILRAEKIRRYREKHESLSRTDLRSLALQLRQSTPEVQQVYSQAAQNVADRVAIAFRNYFERRARFPKTKNIKDYRSFTYPQSGFKLDSGRLHLSKIGKVRIFQHRPLQGAFKRLTIKYEAGEWYAIFLTEQEPPAKPKIDTVPLRKIRGADMGLESFVTLDDATSAEYPQFLRASEEQIKHLQRRLARKRKESGRRHALDLQLAKLHLHVARQREDWQNKLIAELFQHTDILILERLNVTGMLKNRNLAKAISDSAWGNFAGKCVRKADLLGKHIVFVDPWGTSQFCHQCLTWVPKSLAEREHLCPNCEADLPRDVNSAKLIKRLGILKTRRSPPSDRGLSPVEPKPLPVASLRRLASQGHEAGSQRL
jgi:putative transposase